MPKKESFVEELKKAQAEGNSKPSQIRKRVLSDPGKQEKTREQYIADLETNLKQALKDAKIGEEGLKAAKQVLNQKDKVIQEKDEQLKNKDDLLEKKEEKISQLKDRIKQLTNKGLLAEKEAYIQELETNLETALKKNESLKEQLSAQRLENHEDWEETNFNWWKDYGPIISIAVVGLLSILLVSKSNQKHQE